MKYYTADEVRIHNSEDDCWVTIFDDVFDITSLLAENRGTLAIPLIENAGTSISHWFDEKKKDVKTHIDPIRNVELPFTPWGRFIHVPPPAPMAMVNTTILPWWKDSKYIIGKLTKKTRTVRVMNMLTKSEDVITSCVEETIDDLQTRYMEYNRNSKSYTWKVLKGNDIVELDMSKTLDENGIIDESQKYEKLGFDDEFYVPTLHIYYNDDLNYA